MKWWKETTKLFKEHDPAIHSNFEIFLYPTLYAVGLYRISHWLYNKEKYSISRLVSQFARLITGIELHGGAKIGKNFFIDHGIGVVVGETAVIGNNCVIYHNVTLGGTGNERGDRHPKLGDNVMIGSGSILLGNIHIGDNVKVGAGSVIVENIPANHTVVGTPSTRRLIPHKDLTVVKNIE